MQPSWMLGGAGAPLLLLLSTGQLAQRLTFLRTLVRAVLRTGCIPSSSGLAAESVVARGIRDCLSTPSPVDTLRAVI